MVTAVLVLATVPAGPAAAGSPSTPAPTERSDAIDRLDAAVDRWDRSCRKPDAHGLCITIAPQAPTALRCGVPRLGRVRVQARRTPAARRAHEALTAAITEAEEAGPPTDPALASRYVEALAHARIARADRELERYLALSMPTDLDFFVEEWKKGSGIPKWESEYEAQRERKERSTRRFMEYHERKVELAKSLREAYGEVMASPVVHVRPALALRMAFVMQHMADQLRSALVPKSL
ncbi:MAG: hypothetical protein KDK70_21990, partial [Myxococcales bacterium]|nr:hypothetical protein [Myxococcales bacterium]